jgi:hypothetical protein
MSWEYFDHLIALHPALPPTIVALSACVFILLKDMRK